MTEAPSFDDFFEAVHGYAPFPWQRRLAEQVVDEGRWPDQLDLPTASGKTAALDIAVWHLAVEAGRSPRRAPLRIAFVVDRRLIVDEAFARAATLQAALQAVAEPAVKWVAERLRSYAGDGESTLAIQRLRGGVPRQDDWARTPNQPTILVSTVDQVGSRLLFRGYGVSPRMAPVHAGLLGADALLLLDEAHLSRPFEETLGAIETLRGEASSLPWGAAVLTATPIRPAVRPFALSEADRAHPVLGPRLSRPKPVILAEVASVPGASAEEERAAEIKRRAREALAHLERQPLDGPPAIGVIVNRVARARAVFEQLRAAYAPAAEGDEPSADVTLLIGPARGVDRDRRAAELAPLRTGRGEKLPRPMILVATQTVEAGVDLDFDGLISEAAPLDALRQRWGRLNRSGRHFTPYGLVLAHKAEDLGRKPDPLYRQALRAAWEQLQEWAGRDALDVAPDRLTTRVAALSEETLAALVTGASTAPVLMPAYVDLWTQTSPQPAADPEPALFLHGSETVQPSVQIVWREDLELDRTDPELEGDLSKLFATMPPRSAEAVQVSLSAARRWLQLERERSDPNLNDLGELGASEENGAHFRNRLTFRWAGEDSKQTGLVRAAGLSPGDTVIVPASYGGCDDYGWAPDCERPVPDVAELAAEPYATRRFAVRIHPGVFSPVDGSAEKTGDHSTLPSLPTAVATALEGASLNGSAVLAALLREALPGELRRALKRLEPGRGQIKVVYPYGTDSQDRPRGVVLLAPRGTREENGAAGNGRGLAVTGDDDLALAAGRPLALETHSEDVEQNARRFAARAGLPDRVTGDLALAGWLHDAGKADPRFQRMLGSGDPLGLEGRAVLAKSGRTSIKGEALRAGLPSQWRHEALSVRLALKNPRLAEANDPALVLWLVGVHHGYGRPFFPHADPLDGEKRDDLPVIAGLSGPLGLGPGPQSLAFALDGEVFARADGGLEGAGWVQLFTAMKRRYGPWGLAHLEAVLRLADHRASETSGEEA